MKIEASLGDVVDRVTILDIKRSRLRDPGQRLNVDREHAALHQGWAATALPPMHTLDAWAGLQQVNEALWEVEDDLRDHERRGDFGPEFVRLARSVYHLNDRRAALKRAINEALGSELVEEKSYADYGGRQDPTDR